MAVPCRETGRDAKRFSILEVEAFAPAEVRLVLVPLTKDRTEKLKQ